jgi:hypothetical protein
MSVERNAYRAGGYGSCPCVHVARALHPAYCYEAGIEAQLVPSLGPAGQLNGGMIWGVSFAPHERAVMDPRSGV